MSDHGKVLVVIDEGEVRIHSTPGTDVICIVDGESMDIPDDWRGRLTQEVTHKMPISVAFEDMFREPDRADGVEVEPGIFVAEEETSSRVMIKPPYCMICDDNHPQGQCPITDYYQRDGCHCCRKAYGEKHSPSCSDQNPLVEGGDVVGGRAAVKLMECPKSNRKEGDCHECYAPFGEAHRPGCSGR